MKDGILGHCRAKNGTRAKIWVSFLVGCSETARKRLARIEEKEKKVAGPTEIWTRIAGFRVQSANHYTMGPYSLSVKENYQVERLIATDFFIADLDLRSGSTDLYKDFVQSIEWKFDKNE